MKKILLSSTLLLFPYMAFAQVNANDNLTFNSGCPFGADRNGYWGGMMGEIGNMMRWGGMPFFGWTGGIAMLVFWVLAIVGVVVLIKYLVSGGASISKKVSSSATDILKLRYAKGKIDKKEF